jgi:hypothetical protein
VVPGWHREISGACHLADHSLGRAVRIVGLTIEQSAPTFNHQTFRPFHDLYKSGHGGVPQE